MNKIYSYIKKFDWIIFASVFLLISFGLVEIYSINLSIGQETFDNFQKQLIFVIIGLCLFFLFTFIGFENYNNFGYIIYLIGFSLLLGVLFFGVEIRGTRGWYNIFGLSLQPVEFAKISLLIFLAKYLSEKSLNAKPLKHIVFTVSAVLVYSALIFFQPEFGSALILIGLWGAMMLIAGLNLRYVLYILMIGAVVFLSGWIFFFQDYQKQRIITFLNPAQPRLEEGYNIRQAIIAVGSGGLIGRGVGFGSQSHLKFLPESQNDFIFAVIAEELGFLGVVLVLLIFGIFFFRLLSAAKGLNNDFGIYFLLGAGSLIFIEMFINIGMNIGILPVVGISLPFLSYGGSTMISTLILVGICENIIIKNKIKY